MIERYYPIQCSSGLLELSVKLDGDDHDTTDEHRLDHCVFPAYTRAGQLACALEVFRPCDAPGVTTTVEAKIMQNVFGARLEIEFRALLDFHIDKDCDEFEQIEHLLRSVAAVAFDNLNKWMVSEIFQNSDAAVHAITKRLSQQLFPTDGLGTSYRPDFATNGNGQTVSSGLRAMIEQIARDSDADEVMIGIFCPEDREKFLHDPFGEELFGRLPRDANYGPPFGHHHDDSRSGFRPRS